MHMHPSLHPTLAPVHDLPGDILFVIPTIDFLLYEQLDMVDRLQQETRMFKEKGPDLTSIRVEKWVFEGQLHGWLECTA